MTSRQQTLLTNRSAPRRGPGRPPYDSAQTREAIMDAAEELFATFGVEGVSIRSINAAAGLAPAAVHYHFQSKDRLLDAIIHRRGDAVMRRIAELLAALETDGAALTARDLVAAIATPYIELLERDPVVGLRFARLVARLVLAEDARLAKFTAGPDGLDRRFMRILYDIFHDVPPNLVEMSWRISISTLIQMMGNSDSRAAHMEGTTARVSKTYLDLLVDFVASGFAAVIAAKRQMPTHPAGVSQRRLPREG